VSSINFKSSGNRATDKKFDREIKPQPIGIKTPLRFGTGVSGLFEMHTDLGDQIQDNLKNLILTNHGERLGLYDFGANLRELTTERLAKDDFDAEVMRRIRSAVEKYMPYVELSSFESSFANPPAVDAVSEISIKVFYNIPRLGLYNKGIEIILHCIG
jgi:phage baseplate assembly protein W